MAAQNHRGKVSLLQANDLPKKRGRRKRTWMVVVRIDMKRCNPPKDLAQGKLEHISFLIKKKNI